MDPRTSRSSFSAISSGCCSGRRAHSSSGPSTGSSSRQRVGSSRVTAGSPSSSARRPSSVGIASSRGGSGPTAGPVAPAGHRSMPRSESSSSVSPGRTPDGVACALKRAPQARDPPGSDDDPNPAPDGAARSCPAAQRPSLDRVPADSGAGDHRLRLLHRRDRLAPDALHPRVHRARQPADPPERVHRAPRLGLGHPAGPEPRAGPRWQLTRHPVPHPRPGREVQPVVRRGRPLGRGPADRDALPRPRTPTPTPSA